jgi:NAD+ synthase (glutamine-hydrolysing)
MNSSDKTIIRVGAATIENKVADVQFNLSSIEKAISKAKSDGCNLICFPEMSLTSYSCADLFYHSALHKSIINSIQSLCEISLKYSSSFFIGAPIKVDSKTFNCALFFSSGKLLGIIPKTYLPNSNEYYEKRWFVSEAERHVDFVKIKGENIPFGADLIFHNTAYDNLKISAEICEDLWAPLPPSSYFAVAGVNVVCNLSASDEYLGKAAYRKELIKNQSARLNCAYVYSAAGPGESTTDIVFSGHSIISENGAIQAEADRFRFDTQIIYSDIDLELLSNERSRNISLLHSKSPINYRIVEYEANYDSQEIKFRKIDTNPFVPSDSSVRNQVCREIFNIQTTALAKRLKSIGTKNVVLGLSGGLDSTLALLVCKKTFETLDYDFKGIHCVTMPGFGTSGRTKNNADKLAECFDVSYRDISIVNSVRAHFKDIEHKEDDYSVVFENAQARERTQILMDISNQVNGIVIGTGDLSEIALGWSTYNADHMSMYAVNCGIPKTLVKYIVKWCAESEFEGEASKYLLDVCDTPISPELLPLNENGEIAQNTELSVGPYELNDFFLYYFVRRSLSMNKIFKLASYAFQGKYESEFIIKYLEMFIKRFFTSQFKRSCIPDGPKVGAVALSPRGDWRMSTDSEFTEWMNEIELIKKNL